MRVRILAAFIIVLTFSDMAGAADACRHQPAIVALSDLVIRDRTGLPRLVARRFGAEPAFLKMRYGNLPPREARALADELKQANVHNAADLAGALAATEGGFEAIRADAGNLFLSNGGISTIRAVILKGDADKLFAFLATLSREKQAGAFNAIIGSVIDRPDDKKAKLADLARQNGLLSLSAGFAAAARNPDAWKTFATTVPDPETLLALTRFWSWMPALVGNPVLPRSSDRPEDIASRAVLHALTINSAMMPERDFLMGEVNQSYDLSFVPEINAATSKAFSDGQLKSKATLDRAWLFVFRQLQAARPYKVLLDENLRRVSVMSWRYPPPSGALVSVRDVLDRLVAAEALALAASGKGYAPYAEPAEISKEFIPIWPIWVEVAKGLQGPLGAYAADPIRAEAVTDLLMTMEDSGRLADFIASIKDPQLKLTLATDFAMRLDRLCSAVLYHQAEAIILSGQPIFKFDTPL
ncbi:hypothetical protein KX729_03630 [Rhizobium sp. XQZ8]|uniref:hypothetical protein n=1 Tax=Rhizobium populisoli TaxID=2859785 RepID=UPI001CA4FACE|nr:hypothetical protein [Rhizobium populisoli]MBW6420520.1 hypothetical protein [Rhizobium populisoli]